MKKKILIMISLVVSIIVALLLINNYTQVLSTDMKEAVLNEGEFKYNEDGSTSIGLNMSALSFRDINTNRKINSGTIFEPTNGVLEGRIHYQQNYVEDCNYILIVLVDYVKKDFMVNGMNYSEFTFTLEKEDEIIMDIKVENIDEKAHEFTYLIIKDINVNELYENEKELSLWMLRETIHSFGGRFLLNESQLDDAEVRYEMDLTSFKTDRSFLLSIVYNHKLMDQYPIYNSNDELEILIENEYDYELEYSLLGFLDWKQVSLDGDNLIKTFKIPPNTNVYFKITAPNIYENTPFQIFGFPGSFSRDIGEYGPRSTYKLLLIP